MAGKSSQQNRENKTGCPYCSGNRVLAGYNDLASRFPELAEEWSKKNLPVEPNQILAYTNKKYWWTGKCGHEWLARVADRSKGHGCPYCGKQMVLTGYNDLKTLYPSLAAEWSERNQPLVPSSVPTTRNGMFWWTCSECHQDYRAWISSRISGSKCPYCSGRDVRAGVNDITTTDPSIAGEWDYELNGDIAPQNVFRTSRKEYWWKCRNGHSWKAKVYDRTVMKMGCTKCEAEFVQMLPQLLLLLYGGRKNLKVLFNSNQLIGIGVECIIPGLRLVIETESETGRITHDQQVKAFMCQKNGFEYVLLKQCSEAKESAEQIRALFRKKHIYIASDIDSDINLARLKFYELKEGK